MLVSRSAGKLCRLRLAVLWALAWLQVLLLVGFVADGATQRWVGASLLAPAGVVGLLGGTLYVQTALAIDGYVMINAVWLATGFTMEEVYAAAR